MQNVFKKFGAVLLGAVLSASAIAATISASELATLNAGGSITLTGPTVVTPPTPPSPPNNGGSPPAGALMIYNNGVFSWASTGGDYSWNLNRNYQDTSGKPSSGTMDISIQLTGANGGWLPYYSAHGPYLDVSKYTKLVFSLKPTIANQSWNVYFVAPNDDETNSKGVDPVAQGYGPAPIVGKWAQYSIPLSQMNVGNGMPLGTLVYKFCIHDQTGMSNTLWYIDNVYLAP